MACRYVERPQAVGLFWIASLATAPLPFIIHLVLIKFSQATRHGPYVDAGEGAMFIVFLPIVSALLSTLATVALAARI